MQILLLNFREIIKDDDLQMKKVEIWDHTLKWGLAQNSLKKLRYYQIALIKYFIEFLLLAYKKSKIVHIKKHHQSGTNRARQKNINS